MSLSAEWIALLEGLDAKLVALKRDSVVAQVGAGIRGVLAGAGSRYASYPDWPETVLVESARHVSWRLAMAQALRELDGFAVLADGGPPTEIDESTPGVSFNAVRSRLSAALKRNDLQPGHRANLEAALRVSLPAEPRFFVDEYYRDPANPDGKRFASSNATLGAIEARLREAMAAAQAWLQVAG